LWQGAKGCQVKVIGNVFEAYSTGLPKAILLTEQTVSHRAQILLRRPDPGQLLCRIQVSLRARHLATRSLTPEHATHRRKQGERRLCWDCFLLAFFQLFTLPTYFTALA
jgi:hypothetical protein